MSLASRVPCVFLIARVPYVSLVARVPYTFPFHLMQFSKYLISAYYIYSAGEKEKNKAVGALKTAEVGCFVFSFLQGENVLKGLIDLKLEGPLKAILYNSFILQMRKLK